MRLGRHGHCRGCYRDHRGIYLPRICGSGSLDCPTAASIAEEGMTEYMSSYEEARMIRKIATLKRRALYTRLAGALLAFVVIATCLTRFWQVPVSLAAIIVGLLMFLGIGFPTLRGLKQLEAQLAQARTHEE
jgi:hypothetical protein